MNSNDEAVRFDTDKKWKYLHFCKNPDSLDGWSLGVSDEPSGVSRDRLLSAAEIAAKTRDEVFYIVFSVMVGDPQLIECSDGLHEVWWNSKKYDGCQYRIFPVHFNRSMWRQFSHYVRRKQRSHDKNLSPRHLLWMNVRQLEQAKILMEESLEIYDTPVIDRLLAWKKQ